MQVAATLAAVLLLLLAVSSIRDSSQAAAIEYNGLLDAIVQFLRDIREATGEVYQVHAVKLSETRGVMVHTTDAEGIPESVLGDVLRFVPVSYVLTALLGARVVHFCLGYMYTLVMKDACRSHVAHVAVRHVDGGVAG